MCDTVHILDNAIDAYFELCGVLFIDCQEKFRASNQRK